LRECRPELLALINSGHCSWHTTYDFVLTDGNQMFLSTGDIHVNRFGKNQQYISKVTPDVGELSMSAGLESDTQEFKVENVDLVIGQLLTSNVRRMDGSDVLIGILFIDTTLPLSQAIWDARMPTILAVGEVADEEITFSVVSSIDILQVAGRTISNEFPWQEPISVTPPSDPNDIPIDDGGGRYGDPIDLPIEGWGPGNVWGPLPPYKLAP